MNIDLNDEQLIKELSKMRLTAQHDSNGIITMIIAQAAPRERIDLKGECWERRVPPEYWELKKEAMNRGLISVVDTSWGKEQNDECECRSNRSI